MINISTGISPTPSPALRTRSHIPAAQLAYTVTIGTYNQGSPGAAIELLETNITTEGGHCVLYYLPQHCEGCLSLSAEIACPDDCHRWRLVRVSLWAQHYCTGSSLDGQTNWFTYSLPQSANIYNIKQTD